MGRNGVSGCNSIAQDCRRTGGKGVEGIGFYCVPTPLRCTNGRDGRPGGRGGVRMPCVLTSDLQELDADAMECLVAEDG